MKSFWNQNGHILVGQKTVENLSVVYFPDLGIFRGLFGFWIFLEMFEFKLLKIDHKDISLIFGFWRMFLDFGVSVLDFWEIFLES